MCFLSTQTTASTWVVWVETESPLHDAKNKNFIWQIVTQNVVSGEQIILDKSTFITNKFNVSQFINYTPDKLGISDDNIVAYCKTSPKTDKVSSQIIAFDLSDKKLTVIAQTDDVNNEYIENCCVYGTVIIGISSESLIIVNENSIIK